MKHTLVVTILLSFLLQTLPLVEAKALPPVAAAAAANAAKKPKWYKKYWGEPGADVRFAFTIGSLAGIFGFVTNEMFMPHVIRGLCKLESRTTGARTLLPNENTCRMVYGDPKLNSCLVAGNAVALRIPNPDDEKTSIRFTGNFNNDRLFSIRQQIVSIGKDKEIIPVGTPIEVFIDGEQFATDIRLSSSHRLLKSNANEDEQDMFQFYDEVASVLRSAFTECRGDMYDKTMQQIVKQHSGQGAQIQEKR